MDNQHRKIKGYRDLSQAEVDLMNRIKAKGAELLQLQAELVEALQVQQTQKRAAVNAAVGIDAVPADQELARFMAAEPFRWAAIGKTDIQTALMALVRAVAQPEGC